MGCLLGFTVGCGIVGLRVGLAMDLDASGVYLLRARRRKSRALARGEFTLAAVAD